LSRRRRILICTHPLAYGGSQQSIHHWARHLDPSRFEVVILASERGGLSEKFERHYEVHYDADEYPRIGEYLDRLAPDLVHACPGGGVDHRYIAEAARRVPVTQTMMCPRRAGNLDACARVVVPSEYVLALQPDPTKIVHIDHPFDPSEYDPRFDRAHFGLPEDKLLVLSLGNERPDNDHFVRIARRCRDADAHFVIRTSRRYPLAGRRRNLTLLRRFVSEDEKLSLFRLADVFLYPTREEAYGIVFLEAMSQRTPILSYADSAMPEVIGRGGILAPLGDVGRLAELLDHLLHSPRQRERLGDAGFELCAKRNDPRAIAARYAALFDEVLGTAAA
jgi:glycosyltransferase involved in cell wall biosynthesis